MWPNSCATLLGNFKMSHQKFTVLTLGDNVQDTVKQAIIHDVSGMFTSMLMWLYFELNVNHRAS